MLEKIDQLSWLKGGGEMSTLIQSVDWAKTPLGAIENWPQELKTTVSLCLGSNFPINILWGAEAAQIYNDGYIGLCGDAHPRALGESYKVTWASAWPALGEPFAKAFKGTTSFLENQRMFLTRNGYLEETFFTFSLSPIRNNEGQVVGLFHPVTETTTAMLSARRLKAIRDIATNAGNAQSAIEACQLVAKTLSEHEYDLPFAILYLADSKDEHLFRMVGSTGLPTDSNVSPQNIDIKQTQNSTWPLANHSKTLAVVDLETRFGKIICRSYPEIVKSAFILPITSPAQNHPLGYLIVGVSPRLPLNDAYKAHFEILAGAVNAVVHSARTLEEEKRRAEALAEIDRAKTNFFSNISHEFRTPLTLMLGPSEDLLHGLYGQLNTNQTGQLEIVHRNSLRLLKLVNALLDFSRIESGRMQASYEPVDICTATRDLASSFRSAVERAEMKLIIDCDSVSEPIFIDKTMYEKIVLNLLSNAFKYTLAGEIKVTLRNKPNHVELAVQDTGIGISTEELPKVFHRFHRVQGAKGRTHEGTGIGLALVQELARLHGGEVTVQSKEHKGSTFRVQIPKGTKHLPEHQLMKSNDDVKLSAMRKDAFAEEASRMIATNSAQKKLNTTYSTEAKKRVVVADDNRDMLQYIVGLLGDDYEIEAVENGQLALEAIRREKPNLVISDIMMPVLDGIGLLKSIRTDDDLRTLPVMLLSARAGEEAKTSGIEMGADDYLIKPFAAKELIARVKTQLELNDIRQKSIAHETVVSELQHLIALRDEFLSVASHELKTPLTSLKMQLEMANKRFKQEPSNEINDKLTKAFSISLRQTDYLTSLIEDLLDISKIRLGRIKYSFEDYSLSNSIADVLTRYSETLGHAHCKVKTQLDDSIVAKWDKTRIEQVLVNLLSNATKYATNSTIRIETSFDKFKKIVRISISDNGPGIAKEKLEKIFERYERGVDTTQANGLGLGLFIAKSIVTGHGGTIKVESQLGTGTQFIIQLPLNPESH